MLTRRLQKSRIKVNVNDFDLILDKDKLRAVGTF